MLRAFAQAFKTPDLRRKIIFSLIIMALYRLGTFVPTPGVSAANVRECIAVNSEGANLLDMFNLFSGGALLQLSVFALGIMPYITASIIIQVLRVAVPRFDDLYKEGQSGQAKLTQYTRYLTIFLAILQSTTMIALASSGQLFPGCSMPVIVNAGPTTYLFMVLVMTAGTAVIMWFGELITEKGIGNGMSLLIFTSIVSSMPMQLFQIGVGGGWGKVAIIVVLILLVTVAVVFVEQAQRRIPVQYAKRMVGRRTYGGTTTYIPLKINMAGVIPVIFSTSILALPPLVAQFGSQEDGWVQWIQRSFDQTSWVYLLVNGLLIIAFAFFYTSITFNPDEVADNMKRYGGFIPGFRAGKPTAEYLRYVMNRLTTVGALYLAIIAILPSIIMIPLKLAPGQMPFGGTTLLIMVGVGLQTVKDINAQLQQHHYEGFLK
ncbi:preprotein translocase subunit SecY [Actinomycetaceae bacterium WB03_NA08]|uniref:Protein translocase subunit SecY n=1 Tax=Scrofimicrobium canadense TaxID=2652290 RepID=A0A6N7VPW5_9ACTO|nr:preprotein translocase subunit SecY [Scrofimicrobium canadense]MSS83794.1 preprotein translocase subunit SecY [Scrofimicrobium canadense]